MEPKEDLQILIGATAIAWVTNRTIVLMDGGVFRCPEGWEAYRMLGAVEIRFEPPTPEFCNA